MINSAKGASAALLIASLAMTAGCASTGDVDELRAELARANAAAERAAADAASARQDAAAARAAAEKAQAEAAETNEKLDRMFKKSMYK
jgi:murein lipoprotein